MSARKQSGAGSCGLGRAAAILASALALAGPWANGVRAEAATKPPTARSAALERQTAAVRKLGATDPEAVRAGITALRELGGDAAQRALIARVRAGLPPALVGTALDALVAMRARRALPVIVELVQHRRPLVRSQALAALAALEQRGARATQTLLLAALEDPSPDVRGAAASALGRVGTKTALPALFAAYDRGVTSALPAIAELAGRESIEPLLARMPQGVVEPVEPALDRLLENGKLATADQISLAERLTKLGTPSARRYLLKWLDRIKSSRSQARVKAELFEALKTLNAAPTGAPGPTPAPAATARAVAVKEATP